ncbi:myeloid differentiation primary response protein MyD88-like isoform X2 [Saccostrea cucullata]
MTVKDFDAFVIYNPVGTDLEFVKLMASVMEAPPYNLKLFIPWRDYVHEDHYVSADLIENKCQKCIVVLSNNFAGSQSAEFQLKYATSLSPANLHNRVIPICLERCKIPEALRYMCTLQYYKEDTRPWFWKRLNKAFTINTGTDLTQGLKEGANLPDIILDTSAHIFKRQWTLT